MRGTGNCSLAQVNAGTAPIFQFLSRLIRHPVSCGAKMRKSGLFDKNIWLVYSNTRGFKGPQMSVDSLSFMVIPARE